MVTMGIPLKFRGLATFNLFTFSRLSSSLRILWSWKSAMSSRFAELRAAAVSTESLTLSGFSNGETDLVLRRLFSVYVVWLCLSYDWGLVFFCFFFFFFGGGKVQVVKEKVELEKRGHEREKAHAAYKWVWFCFNVEGAVQLGLVEEVDEIFLDEGVLKLFFWRGLFWSGCWG